LASDSSASIDRQTRRVGGVLREYGFEIREVVEGLLLLRGSTFPFVERRYGDDRRTAAVLDDGLRRLIGRFAAVYAGMMIDSIRKAQARTTLMLEAAETAGSTLESGRVLGRVVEGIASALRVACCAIYEANSDATAFEPRAQRGSVENEQLRRLLARPLRPAIDPLVRRVLESPERSPCTCAGKEAFLGETTCRSLALASAVAVPIATADRVVALALGLNQDPTREFSPRRIELAWGIARTVAPAVSNAHLFEETRRQLFESRSLQEVTTALLSGQTARDVLQIICGRARDLAAAKGALVIGWGGDEHRQTLAEAGSIPQSPDRFIAHLDRVAAGAFPREPLRMGSIYPETGPPLARSLLSVPLASKQETIGALILIDRPGGFLPHDQRMIHLFADQAVLAIEHARLSAKQERLAVLEERQKLARDLHDSVTQSLYGVTMYAEAAARLLEAGRVNLAGDHLRQLSLTSLDALREMRLLIYELRPPELEQEGLIGTLQARLAAVEGRSGLKSDVTVEGVGRLPPDLEEGLHRIAMEALNNTLKHARASRVDLSLRGDGSRLVMEIRDDGDGFDLEVGRVQGGSGLRNMAERAASLGAEMDIQSAPGEGTLLRVAVTLERANRQSSGEEESSHGESSDPRSPCG